MAVGGPATRAPRRCEPETAAKQRRRQPSGAQIGEAMAAITPQDEQMTKRFGGLIAVDRLDLEVKEKTIHSIIGPNGAGKTTVFNCIMDFYRPMRADLVRRPARRRACTPDRVGRRGHQPDLSEHPPVPQSDGASRTSWSACTSIYGPNSDRCRRNAGHAQGRGEAHRRGAADARFRRPRAAAATCVARNLAYGEQRRLEIGRALATRPTAAACSTSRWPG